MYNLNYFKALTLIAFWRDGQIDKILVASGPLIYDGRTERESILKDERISYGTTKVAAWQQSRVITVN
jgi:UDP-glucose 4-epimerase